MNKARLSLALFALLVSGRALGLAFTPSEAEWVVWPEFCQARYMASAAGSSSEFAGRIPPGTVEAWRQRIGAAWYGLHHHCAGLIFQNRARATTDPTQRKRLVERAIGEHRYTLARTPIEHPMYADMAVSIGMAYRLLGDHEQALNYFDRAINAHPTLPDAWQAKAMVYRDQKRLDDAREVLLKGNEAVGGNSADIHYFLGLVCADARDMDCAVEHARRAYELGYPLPGLRERLAAAGVSL